jgi:hypothetical protein
VDLVMVGITETKDIVVDTTEGITEGIIMEVIMHMADATTDMDPLLMCLLHQYLL